MVKLFSLDGTYLNVTENKKEIPSPTLIACEIQKIQERNRLTASGGISINKFTVKIVTDINKPNGQKPFRQKKFDFFRNPEYSKILRSGKNNLIENVFFRNSQRRKP